MNIVLIVSPSLSLFLLLLQPNRTYYLDDPDGYAMQWVDAIENMSKLCYGDAAAAAATGAATTTSISSCGSSNSLAVQQQSSSNSSSALLNSNSPASNNSSPTARRSSPQQQQRKSDVTTPAASASTSTATATRGLKTASNWRHTCLLSSIWIKENANWILI